MIGSSLSPCLSAAVSFCLSLSGSSRVGIVGSREFAPLSLVAEFVASLSADLIIVSGAAKGVDAHAAACARAHNLEVLEIPADWRRGKSAGMQRNAEIVCSSDVIIAFWDGSSAGTAHSVELARRSGIPMFVVRQPAAASAPEQLALF